MYTYITKKEKETKKNERVRACVRSVCERDRERQRQRSMQEQKTKNGGNTRKDCDCWIVCGWLTDYRLRDERGTLGSGIARKENSSCKMQEKNQDEEKKKKGQRRSIESISVSDSCI